MKALRIVSESAAEEAVTTGRSTSANGKMSVRYHSVHIDTRSLLSSQVVGTAPHIESATELIEQRWSQLLALRAQLQPELRCTGEAGTPWGIE